MHDDSPGSPPSVRPFWVPQDVSFDDLPHEAQLALTEIVQPAYCQLVLGAADALERSWGLSIVYLLWLEVVSQLQLGRQISQPDSLDATPLQDAQSLSTHLRILSAKNKLSDSLMRLRSQQDRANGRHLTSEAIRAVAESLNRRQRETDDDHRYAGDENPY